MAAFVLGCTSIRAAARCCSAAERQVLRHMASAQNLPGYVSLLDQPRKVYGEEYDLVRHTARKFFEEKVKPFHSKWEEEGVVSRELWQQAGENGLLAVTVPEEYGGPGCDIKTAAVIWEEQGYSGCFGPSFSIHSEIVVPYIKNYGTEEQKQKYLPGLCSGEIISAIAMTEPAAGSDLQGIQTNAQRVDDGWLLNGSKTFISNGMLADLVIVVAKTDQSAKAAHGMSLFLVEKGTPGFSKGKNLKKVGLKAQDTSELFFEDVKVTDADLLGGENKGFYRLMDELPQERILIAALGVSHAAACYEWTRTYIKDRKAFGGTLADLPTVQHKMAELKTQICVAQAFVDECLELHQEHNLTHEKASMAKYHCTELQSKIADECLQLHGGYGYMWEYDIARAFVDARVQRIYGGSNEIMKNLIARTI